MPGKFVHFNTIEEYQAFDFLGLRAEDFIEKPENYFVLACFGDLKNYDFYYKCALIQGSEKIKTIKGKKLAKCFDKD